MSYTIPEVRYDVYINRQYDRRFSTRDEAEDYAYGVWADTGGDARVVKLNPGPGHTEHTVLYLT